MEIFVASGSQPAWVMDCCSPDIRWLRSNPARSQSWAGGRTTHVLPVSLQILTGHRSEHIWDENFHQGLVQDVIAASHPLEDRFIFTQSDQFIFWEGSFVFFFTAWKKEATLEGGSPCVHTSPGFLMSVFNRKKKITFLSKEDVGLIFDSARTSLSMHLDLWLQFYLKYVSPCAWPPFASSIFSLTCLSQHTHVHVFLATVLQHSFLSNSCSYMQTLHTFLLFPLL